MCSLRIERGNAGYDTTPSRYFKVLCDPTNLIVRTRARGDQSMLHIHNGESTAGTLKEFGFPGEHFAFQEVLMCGPTPAGLSADEWREVRGGFLIDEYDLKPEDYERNLLLQEESLRGFSDHEEVTLWFEHDLFCQINLVYLLDWFSKQTLGTTRLSLICIGEFAGIEDFRGLG